MTITALPTPPSRSDDPAGFSAKADAFLAALPTFVTEANATGSAADDAAAAAEASAIAAASSASSASNQRTLAETAKTAAETAQGIAEAARDDAQAAQEAVEGAIAAGPVLSVNGRTGIVTGLAEAADLAAKQDALASGTNIKTVNGSSILGSGDLAVAGGLPLIASGSVSAGATSLTLSGLSGKKTFKLVVKHGGSVGGGSQQLQINSITSGYNAGSFSGGNSSYAYAYYVGNDSVIRFRHDIGANSSVSYDVAVGVSTVSVNGSAYRSSGNVMQSLNGDVDATDVSSLTLMFPASDGTTEYALYGA